MNKKVIYCNEIIDGGDHPIFRVTPSDDPTKAVDANSASSAWKTILDRIQDLRQEGSKRTSISGPEFFGFSHPMIMELLESLPGAEHMPRLVKPGRKEDPAEGTVRAGGSFTDRLRAFAQNKMPEDSMEVATDEGDDEDFLIEMQRAMPRGRYKPQQNEEDEEEEGDGAVNSTPNIMDYFRPQHALPPGMLPLPPPPPAMFANYLYLYFSYSYAPLPYLLARSQGDSIWDDPAPEHNVNPLWDETYPMEDPMSYSALPPMSPSQASRRFAASQRRAGSLQGFSSTPQSPQKAHLETEVYNLGEALMCVLLCVPYFRTPCLSSLL